MRKIILERDDPDTVSLSRVDERKPIFAKQDGKLRGMVAEDSKGWALKIGGSYTSTGYHPSRESCLVSCLPFNYEFFVE